MNITSRVIDGLVLSHERLGDADRHASKNSLLGIDKVPYPGVGQCRLVKEGGTNNKMECQPEV